LAGVVHRFLVAMDDVSSKPTARRLMYAGAVLFFVAFILLPPILGITFKLDLVPGVLSDGELMARAEGAIFWSFAIAFTIALFDLVAGVPMAWFIARSGSRWVSVIDALVDIPFVIPTVALGFSTLLFWTGSSSPISLLGFTLSPGLALILLLHFALSYKGVYETAARTLGARAFTVARTVTLPILRPAIIAAFLLAFARSLSETGATIIVAGSFENGPVFIKNAKDAGLEGPMVLVSFTLILASIAVFALIRVLGTRLKLPLRNAYPRQEGALSSGRSVALRNAATIVIFLLFVLIPSVFITFPAAEAATDGTLGRALSGAGIWSNYWQAMGLSYLLGVMATLINIAVGLPVAILIARRRLGKTMTTLLEAAVNVPIVVPSVALGVSLGLFWRSFSFLPEFWVLVFAHTTITYTYFVQAMAASLEGIPTEMEETARTLGSKPLNVFRRIIVPLTKYSIFSGAILTFTRSVDETGATTAVADQLRTAPVLLVSWIKQVVPATTSDIALGISFLVLTSFASLLALRLLVYRRR
jgi:thiamine transport system permease protein